MTLTSLKEKALKNPEVKAEYDRLGNTLTHYKQSTGKTWARIAAELTEHAQARDPDKMSRIYEGRLWRLIGGVEPKPWEAQALEDLCGAGTSYK